ncbi:MAG: hypothetical protein CL827_06905 [Crocinitomicaceae bacterium]|nr:hypothetical protein [Crocinitomicaceae bacterium]
MSFLVKLQNFFIKNDPDRLYLAKRIARSFRNDEEAIMNRLEEIYSKGGPKKLKVKEITSKSKTPIVKKSPASEDKDDNAQKPEEFKDEKPKKSKKKLFIIIGVVLALAGGGAGYFFTIGSDNSHETEDSQSTESHDSEDHHPVESEKSIEEIEKTIDQAEKDSVAEELIEAGEVLEILH